MNKLFRTGLGLTLLTGSVCSALAAETLVITESSPAVSQNFDSMYANGAATLNLPDGWRVDRNLTAPRTINAWADASSEVMYEGGVSLASNAKNGTWNFGSSSTPSDRAIGGLSTTVANGTRCWSLLTAITNNATAPVSQLQIKYDIEKYRNGANAAGFDCQVYYSTDGSNWTSAGDNFKTHFSPDAETLGQEVVPISTTPSEGNLMVDVAAGKTIYLAWNVSVASGSSPDKAMGLAIDNIIVSATFASADDRFIYIENATGKNKLTIYSASPQLYGPVPGSRSAASKVVNGVTYNVWDMKGSAPYQLSVYAADKLLGSVNINPAQNTYLCASPSSVSVINDPDSYTGWVDPSIPPFVASGLYIRGEINSWGSPSDWEFSNEGNGIYALYNKTLSGQFKISDASWSSGKNYGSNGTNIMADETYNLVLDTDNNISCGTYIFTCSRIVLDLSGQTATLKLISSDDESDLTSVYVVGDFNKWNYMGTDGELKLDEESNLFKGRVVMRAGESGKSEWRLYQRLGRAGVWGASSDNAAPALSGTLTKGNTYNVISDPAAYDMTFDITTGKYTLTKVDSDPELLSLNPEKVTLVPTLPEKVKILSLNNSLIYYNDQAKVFNDIAAAMGKDASWTKHTLLGKTLQTHWDEGDGLAGDGTPGAKMMVRSEAWSHIILQEQTALPRTSLASFRASVKKWVDYIREYCPNPNAVIILPVNWAYAGDWDNFSDYNKIFLENYADVAQEMGVVLCPVGVAYENCFQKEGSTGVNKWFQDDRHPYMNATYMAAAMEFGLIYNIDPTTITYAPSSLSASEAASMRSYAKEALNGYDNAVDHHKKQIKFSSKLLDGFNMEVNSTDNTEFSIDGGGQIDQNGKFTSDGSLGSFTVTAKNGTFEKKSVITVANPVTVVATYPAVYINEENPTVSQNFDSMPAVAGSSMPEAWRIDKQTVGTRVIGSYGMANDSTTYVGGVSLPSNAKNGIYNFGENESQDRAVGGITTGVADGTRAINVYAHIANNGSKKFDRFSISYDVEKYRKGNNAEGFAVQMYYSYDGRNWENAGSKFKTFFEADNATEGYPEVPGEVRNVVDTLALNIGPDMDFYLGWNISVAAGDAAQGAMALALDNVEITALQPIVPETRYRIYVNNQTTWEALGLYAWSGSAAVSEIFGAWPGQAPIDEMEINGTTYQVFGLDVDGGNYNLIFNNWNNNKQLPDYNIDANRDYYFLIDDTKATEIDPSGIADVVKSAPANNNVYNLQGILVLKDADSSRINKLPGGIYIIAGKKVLLGQGK